MNWTVSSIIPLAAALAILISGAPPADAAFTPIGDSPDQFNEPNLLGVNPFPFNPNPSVLETLYGEANLRRVDDAFDTAFRHTGAEATVKPVARFTSIGYRLWQLPNGAGQQDFVIDVVRGASVPGPQGYNLPTQGTGLIPLADSGLSSD